MKHWEKILVSETTSILDTIKIIDDSAMQIAIVVGQKNYLLGTVTDGDIRRGILRNISLDAPVESVMNSNPFVCREGDSPKQILALMKGQSLKHVPIINDSNCIVDLYAIDDMIKDEKRENWVVLMAGGLGSRLYPLTKNSPKPLLRVGNKAILETILEKFIEYDFKDFYISVNYKAELIKKYFEDGTRWGVNIKYLDEEFKLGTAGPLSLLPNNPTKPIIVMNGDLLTKVNFRQLLEYHEEHGAKATMCVREYQHEIPFGVIESEEHRLIGIKEKPNIQYFVNAGIYVFSPEVLQYIPKNSPYDMPTLFNFFIEHGIESNVFPIREYWMDIGRMGDIEKANIEYYTYFGD